MCNPMALGIASFAMGAAGQVQSYNAQAEAASATNDAYEQNRINALESMRNDYSQTQLRQQQEMEAAAEQKRQRVTQERREVASARVAAGESGITGLSVEGLLRDISSLSLNDQSNINQGTDWRVGQLSAEMSGIRTTTQGRINGAPKASGPSPWGAVFGIGNAAVQSYDGYVARSGKDPLGFSPAQV